MNALLELPDTGEAGFEGLIQSTLSAWTGLRFYGARGGRQEGRDGRTGPGSLDIVFETKLYGRAGIKERELLGEIAQATQTCPDLDLYVLATTATMPDLTQRALRNEAEGKDLESARSGLATSGRSDTCGVSREAAQYRAGMAPPTLPGCTHR